jgi:hypothetical protein
MLISVIVKSYQRPFLLRVCLESIRTFWPNRADYEVIVADDGTAGHLWDAFVLRHGDLFDAAIHSTPGESKWQACREGRFSDVVPSCGTTWNEAHARARGDIIFVIEDDSYLIRPSDPTACANVLHANTDLLCLIGLKERMWLDIHGVREDERVARAERVMRSRAEAFAALTHQIWPWSFDGIFFRAADWNQLGPWPTDLPTGPMEGFVQRRLQELGWSARPYGMALDPMCAFDFQNSVRTDPSNYLGRFRHIDAINARWLAGNYSPTFEDVRLGRLPWDHSRSFGSMRLHYPNELRQIHFVTGHELCGELHGEAADARWLAEANNQSTFYGESPPITVPDLCKSL